MAITVERIVRAESDETLLDLLIDELKGLFPREVRDDTPIFLSRLYASPVGLRAMAATYDLDVSMALDDLAWHFLNHHESLDFANETVLGLHELGAPEAAEIFQSALNIMRPHWDELDRLTESDKWHDWLNATGIQGLTDPLSDQMWEFLKTLENSSLMSLWVTYARQHPEKCIPISEIN